MKQFADGIPNKVLKKIFPQKLNSSPASEPIYLHLKRMILSGKLKKGQRLPRWEFVRNFDVYERDVFEAFSQLRKEKLVIFKPGKGSVVA
jgi:DNA-binding GntR family transcriptional regulator